MARVQSNKTVLLSEQITPQIKELFKILGYGCVGLPGYDALDLAVASHPDMLLYKLGEKKLLIDGSYYEKNSDIFLGVDAEFVFSRTHLAKAYPMDIAFDAFILNDTLYGKISCIAPEILEIAKNTANVNQGYAKCSTLLTGKCAITADEGIYKSLYQNGITVLKISPQGIALPGYGSGFIGGASAYDIESDTVVFYGDVTQHPSYEAIKAFLTENGHRILYTDLHPLTDFGGAIFVT